MSDQTMARFKTRPLNLEPGWRGQSSVHDEARTPLLMLLAVTGLVLTACANVANLLLARAAGRAGERAVSASSVPLISGSNWNSSVSVQGFEAGPDTNTTASFSCVGSGFFGTAGIPLVTGREFTPADAGGRPKVAIVNRAFARTFDLGDRAVGRRLATVGALDPNLPVEQPRTMAQQVDENIFLDRMIGTLSSLFAALATTLAAVGLYGVLAFTVAQRTREFGLRMALGADHSAVRGLVLGHVLRMTVAGGVVGLALAVALGLAKDPLAGLPPSRG